MSEYRTIQSQVDAETYAWLRSVATAEGVSVGEIIRRALNGARADDVAAAAPDEPATGGGEDAPPPAAVDVDAVVAEQLEAAVRAGKVEAAPADAGDDLYNPPVRVVPLKRVQRPAREWARRTA